jgi:hypothetical protein
MLEDIGQLNGTFERELQCLHAPLYLSSEVSHACTQPSRHIVSRGSYRTTPHIVLNANIVY